MTWRATPRARVAWLLRANRLLGAEGQWATASRFRAAFPGGAWQGPVSESSISRWETGRVHPTHPAVLRYEQLLELSPGTLVSVVDTIYRYAAPGERGPSDLARVPPDSVPGAYQRLEILVDRACSNAEMTGAEWDELTSHLALSPQLLLVPSMIWERLAQRLVAEMIIADWVAWMQRFEALNRLLNHPVGQVHAIAACAALGADPANRVVVEVVSALDATRHPDAARHVLAQLVSPTSERARYGALLASVRKIRHRHFTLEQCAGLGSLLADLAGDPSQRASIRPLAADLLRRLPAGLPRPIARRLQAAALASDTVDNVLDTGRLIPRPVATLVTSRLAAAALAGLPREAPPEVHAPMVALLDELLFSPQPDVRLFTTMLLASTPYRYPVATALAEYVRGPDVLADPDRSHAVMSALRVLGGPRERALVERLATNPQLPEHAAVHAVYALGHIGGASPDEFWSGAIAQHGQAWRRERRESSALVLEGLVYGIGIARNERLLAGVRMDDRAPTPARAAAAWWLNIPRQVARSAAL